MNNKEDHIESLQAQVRIMREEAEHTRGKTMDLFSRADAALMSANKASMAQVAVISSIINDMHQF